MVDRPLQETLDPVVALIPALNEEESLPGVLRALRERGVHRILVVDNGSTDATARVAREGGAAVLHEPRRGYGQACLTGLQALRQGGRVDEKGGRSESAPGADDDPPEIVLFLDGDQSDDPDALLRILGPLLRDEADLVIGVRAGPADAPPHQRWGTALVTLLARRLHGVQLSDLGPFRAVSWQGLARLQMDDRSWGWTLQMQLRAHRAGLRVQEIPVVRRPRAAGTSKISGSLRMSARVGMRMLRTLLAERHWRPPPSPRPADRRVEVEKPA